MHRLHLLDAIDPIFLLDENSILHSKAKRRTAWPCASYFAALQASTGLLIVDAPLQRSETANKRFGVQQLHIRRKTQRCSVVEVCASESDSLIKPPLKRTYCVTDRCEDVFWTPNEDFIGQPTPQSLHYLASYFPVFQRPFRASIRLDEEGNKTQIV